MPQHSSGGSHRARQFRRMRLLPLMAATFFMVSGGPYGIEDIIGGAGYRWAFVLLLCLPLLWSMPTALMIGELASAIPAEGGFYVWVRRALGSFWGFQEAWLSLAASIFDMAIYHLSHALHTLLGPAGARLLRDIAPSGGQSRCSQHAFSGTCSGRRAWGPAPSG